MTIITVVFAFFVGYMFVTTNINASALQLLKTKQFVELVDSSNGRLLPQFYPNPDDDATPEYFDSMFVVDKQKAATSLLDYTRT
jgi:predicted ABC-type exoprotein transport system permease subunit